jgi:hypothetical protein
VYFIKSSINSFYKCRQKLLERIVFGSRRNQLEYPDFLYVQLKILRRVFPAWNYPENRRKEGFQSLYGKLPDKLIQEII